MLDIINKYIVETFDDNGHLISVDFNVPDNFNFAYDVVDEIAKKDFNKRALVYRDCEGCIREFSFGEISVLSNKTANAFSNRGIGYGDRVMLIMKRRFEYWITVMALHKLGAVVIPTSNMVSEHDILYRFKKADVKAIVCADDDYICKCTDIATIEYEKQVLKYIVGGKRDTYLSYDEEIRDASDIFNRRKTLVSDTMLLYFTSGTTGNPKGVMHNFSYPIGHILTARDWHGVVEDGLHFTVADSGWAKSAWGKMYGQWFMGCAVMVFDYEQFYANEILEIIQECKVTSFCAPPTIYKYFLKENIEEYDLSSVSQVVTAGEPMPIETVRRFEERTGLKIRSGFGQTETALLVAVMKGDEQILDTIGKASPMYNVVIVDEECNPVPDGEEGEIVLLPNKDGSVPIGVFCGYLGAPEMYEEVWSNGVYHTKDKAYRDKDGYYYFVSRTDDVIKSSGYRIGPSEVENVIMEHPAVFECAVTGYPSETRGSIVKATIVLNDGYEPTSKLKVEIQDFVKSKTAMYKYPRKIEFTDELPKTISGKIQREVIRKRDLERLKK